MNINMQSVRVRIDLRKIQSTSSLFRIQIHVTNIASVPAYERYGIFILSFQIYSYCKMLSPTVCTWKRE